MDPVGIEPTPLVLQTSVRTSYTKGPSERYYQLYYPPRRTGWDSNPYLPSQWDTVESNHTFLQNDFTDRLSHQWLKHPNLLINGSRTLPSGFRSRRASATLLTKLLPQQARQDQSFAVWLWTHVPNCRPIQTIMPIFVPRSGIEPLPFACKTNTLPLRQQGKLFLSFYYFRGNSESKTLSGASCDLTIVPPGGLEPPTPPLKAECPSTWASKANYHIA